MLLTATCALWTRSSRPACASAVARRAALDDAGSAAPAWSAVGGSQPPSRRPRDAGRGTAAVCESRGNLHAVDVDPRRAGVIRDVAGLKRPTWTPRAAARLNHGPLLGGPGSATTRFGRLGLPSSSRLHPRRARGHGADRSTCPLLPARFGVGGRSGWPSAASPELRGRLALEVRRARGLFAEAEPAIGAAPASVGRGGAGGASTSGARPRQRSTSTCWPESGPARLGPAGRRAGSVAPVTRRASFAGRSAAARAGRGARTCSPAAWFAGLAGWRRGWRGAGANVLVVDVTQMLLEREDPPPAPY